MFDSANPADVPLTSDLVAGYVDGGSPWSADAFARFAAAGKTVVRICVYNDRFDANMIDIEPGNNDAAGAVPWIAGMWERGRTPTVYCFSDAGPTGYRISDVRAACDAAVPPVRHPLFVIAKWDNDPSTFDPTGDPEIVGKQYANPALTGGHYDASVIADVWPGVDAPRPAPTQPPSYYGQSADLTGTAALRVGQVGQLAAAWDYGHGPRWQLRKVIARRPGRFAVVVCAPVDPDADPTLDLSVTAAIFVVDVAA